MKIINDWLKLPEAYNANFWQYNEFNIQELAFHTHDGTKGDKLPPQSLTQLIENTTGSWVLDSSSGLYYEDVLMPDDFDQTTVSFFENDKRVYLDYEKVSVDTLRVWSAFNDKTYGVRYA
jgi:hypothetical protein